MQLEDYLEEASMLQAMKVNTSKTWNQGFKDKLSKLPGNKDGNINSVHQLEPVLIWLMAIKHSRLRLEWTFRTFAGDVCPELLNRHPITIWNSMFGGCHMPRWIGVAIVDLQSAVFFQGAMGAWRRSTERESEWMSRLSSEYSMQVN